MLKKPITYIDYDGNKRTDDFWFNLDEGEILELQMSSEGGLTAMLEKMIKERDGKRILAMMKRVIMLAYGEKSLDGRRFEKSEEMSIAFTHTRAYSELLMELYRDADAAAEFMNKIIPQAQDTVKTGASTPATPAIEGAK